MCFPRMPRVRIRSSTIDRNKYRLKIVSATTEEVQTRKYSFDYEAVTISKPVQGQFFAIITIISLCGSGFFTLTRNVVGTTCQDSSYLRPSPKSIGAPLHLLP